MEPTATHPRRQPAHRLVAGAAVLMVAAACTAVEPRASGDRAATPAAGAPHPTAVAPPRPLAGRPLAGPTGLRLLVASDPPQLLDVDHGTSRRVGGLPAGQDPGGVSPVGANAVVSTGDEVFLVRRGTTRARRVGHGLAATPSHDGRGLWLLDHGRRCRLRAVWLDGRARRPAVQVPCTTGLVADTALGLHVRAEPPDGGGEQAALLDLDTGRALARYPEIHAVVGDLVLWGDHERNAGPFTLSDRGSGARHRVERPTPHGWAGLGLVSPDRRLLAVEFADASWSRANGQVSDIWLLDLETRRWGRLPGMPLLTGLKFMSMAWTGDGRLVLAGDFERFGEALAVWRPGQDHLATRRLRLPDYAGSDTFVPWPAAGA